MTQQSFADLGVSAVTAAALAKQGATSPFAVQAMVLPDALEGHDLLVESPTGSGKTLAFGVPLVERTDANGPRPAALVLAPTRELASQIVDELRGPAHARALRIKAVYGGVGIVAQEREAAKAHVIVATPGRLIDLLERGSVSLANVRTLVLDEADRMLDMGFRPAVDRIVKAVPRDRQTFLFSATLDGSVADLAARYTRDARQHAHEATQERRGHVEHRFVRVAHEEKLAQLIHELEDAATGLALVFVRTKRGADRLAKRLGARGIEAVAMHGDKSQNQRERALARFERGEVRTLVATDVAARGIDVRDVSHVINFDVPGDRDDYVHRIGRTARAGRSGVGVTLVMPDQGADVHKIAVDLGLEREFATTGLAPSAQHRGGTQRSGGPSQRSGAGAAPAPVAPAAAVAAAAAAAASDSRASPLAPPGRETYDRGRMAEQREGGQGNDGEASAADLLRLAPGLARLAGDAWVRTAGWTITSSAKASARVARAAVRGESVTELLGDAERALRDQARTALGVADLDARVARVVPDQVFGRRDRERPGPDDEGDARDGKAARNGDQRAADGLTLRDRGAALLARSADVDDPDDPLTSHPAYERILDELAPDEARILRLLAADGSQPAVDVKTWRPLDIGAQTMAPGLTMIGRKAGCRHADRVPAYLNNLFRLGLIWFCARGARGPARLSGPRGAARRHRGARARGPRQDRPPSDPPDAVRHRLLPCLPAVIENHAIGLATIPLFAGIIGYVTNWSGIWMLFNPLQFRGFRMPGLSVVATLLPRRVQQIPGVIHGGVGWQGIIPSRAAKMGSIAVDKGIAKLGSPADFYAQLEPDKIAEHILQTADRDLRELVERVMAREHPRLWQDLPPRVREAVHERVRSQLPGIVHSVTERIGQNIDQLLDIKLMVIRHIEQNPELGNRIFLEVGRKELRFIIRFGGVFGFLCGIPTILLVEALPYWWVLPVSATIIGYVTNWLAIWMIFEPIEPRQLGPLRMQGLFLRRQEEAADVYAGVIANDIVTMGNIAEELLHGPSADRTRRMIEDALRPAVDRATGFARGAVRVAVGTREYDAIRDSVAMEGVDYTMTPLTDPEFSRRQSARVRALIRSRMRELPSKDFSEMLRTAMREDEWLLVLHGAVLGFGGGLVHLAIFPL